MASIVRPARIPEGVPLVRFDPPTAEAGERGEWRIRFALPEAVLADAKLGLFLHGGRHGKGRFDDVQVGVEADSGVRVHAGGLEKGEMPLERASDLAAGDVLTVTLRAGAPRVTLCNCFVYLFVPGTAPAAMTKTNMEKARRVLSAAVVDVVGSRLDHLRAYAPSQAAPGESVSVLIRPEDRFGNLSRGPAGRLQALVNGVPVETEAHAVGDSVCRRVVVTLDRPGEVVRVEIQDPQHGLSTTTNPVVVGGCDGHGEKPLWGMIHGHTEFSDGAGTIDHYFDYARNACALDFCAPGDHDHVWETSDGMFGMMCAAVERHHVPGRFVVFPGYEWAKWRVNGDGDRCVYYRCPEEAEFFHSDDGHEDTPAKLFAALQSREALVIPHHTAISGNPCDFREHDPRCERLVEIYSTWGCSERAAGDGNPKPVYEEVAAGFVQRALAMGWRVGFTAGGDDHMGHPGDEIVGDCLYQAGLFAVWASACTREAIWEALVARRTWGTTGPRTVLRFSVAGAPMGSEVSVRGNDAVGVSRRITAAIHATAAVAKAEVIRNNRTIYETVGGTDLAFEFEDRDPLDAIMLPPAEFSPAPFAFYYLRVEQEDGHMAWASPVWVVG